MKQNEILLFIIKVLYRAYNLSIVYKYSDKRKAPE